MPEVGDDLLVNGGTGKPPLDLGHPHEFVCSDDRQEDGDYEEDEGAACEKAPHVRPLAMN